MTQITDPTAAGNGTASLNQMYALHLVAKSIVEDAASPTAQMRAYADDEMLNRYNNSGDEGRVKTHEVVVDGVAIGAFTVRDPQPSWHLDEEGKAELIAWLTEHNPKALSVKMETVIDANVIKKMTDTKFIRFSDEEDGPLYNAKTGEPIPGFKTKLAGKATQVGAAAWTGKAGQIKKEKARAKLRELAANFNLRDLAGLDIKPIEANPAIAGEIIHHQGQDETP